MLIFKERIVVEPEKSRPSFPAQLQLESFIAEEWKNWIIQILNLYDSTDIKIKDWVENLKKVLKQIAKKNVFSYRSDNILVPYGKK